MADTQNYSNHVRWFPLVHFVIMPLLLINLISHIVRFFMATPDRRVSLAFWVLLSIILILMALAARLQALKAQDRLIRLEERLRYREILPEDIARRAADLGIRQIIALRFASDGELAELVGHVLDGKLTTQKEIKMAIKSWRADHLRV